MRVNLNSFVETRFLDPTYWRILHKSIMCGSDTKLTINFTKPCLLVLIFDFIFA